MMVDGRRARARDVGIVLVLALLAVDAVLVVMALRNPTEPPPVTAGETPVPTPTVEATTPVPTETTPPPPPETTDPEPVLATARELPLAVLDADRAVRSTAPGTCAEPGTVEFTTDGGETWEQYGAAPELAVLRVRITEEQVWFVGAGDNCVSDFARTEDGGETWVLSGRTSGAWHLLPDPESAEVHAAPDAVVAGPCGDVAMVELENRTGEGPYVLCADGTVHTSTDGNEWTLVGNAPAALAMGLRDGDPVVAASGAEGCEGLAVLSVEGDAPASLGCVEGAPVDGAALAFAEAGDTGFLVAGGLTWTTEDGGSTWTATTV